MKRHFAWWLVVQFGCAGVSAQVVGKCPAVPIEPETNRNATLPGACHVRDLPLEKAAWAKGWNRDTTLDLYTIVPRVPGVLDILARSTKIDAVLALHAADFGLLKFDDDSGGGASGLDAHIGNVEIEAQHRYYIVVVSRSGSGEYTLKMEFRGKIPPCQSFTLQLNQPIARELEPCGGNSGPEHHYTLQVPRPGRLTVESNAETTLRDSSGRVIHNGAVEPGDYALLVRLKKNGKYTLLAHFKAACPADALEQADGLFRTISNRFTSAACRVTDVAPVFDVPAWRDHYLQRYSFRVPWPSSFKAEIAPPLPHIVVCGGRPAGGVLAAGACELWVMSRVLPAYSLKAALIQTCAPRQLGLNEHISAELSTNHCREARAGRTPSALDLYRIATPRRGRLFITVRSGSFTPYILWGDSEHSSPYEEEVSPATHDFGVGGTGNAQGPYSIDVAFECPVADLSMSRWVEGTVNSDDCRPDDVWRNSDSSPMRRYRFAVGQPGAVVFQASSTSSLTLAVYDSTGSVVGEQPLAMGQASLQVMLKPQTYFLVLKASSKSANAHFRARMELRGGPHPGNRYTLLISSGGVLISDKDTLRWSPENTSVIAWSLHYEGSPHRPDANLRVEWRFNGVLYDLQEFSAGGPLFDRIFTYGNRSEPGDYRVTVKVDGVEKESVSFRIEGAGKE